MTLAHDTGHLAGTLAAANRIADHADQLLQVARGQLEPGRCRAVTWPTQKNAVLCQNPNGHTGRHRAVWVGGICDWDES